MEFLENFQESFDVDNFEGLLGLDKSKTSQERVEFLDSLDAILDRIKRWPLLDLIEEATDLLKPRKMLEASLSSTPEVTKTEEARLSSPSEISNVRAAAFLEARRRREMIRDGVALVESKAEESSPSIPTVAGQAEEDCQSSSRDIRRDKMDHVCKMLNLVETEFDELDFALSLLDKKFEGLAQEFEQEVARLQNDLLILRQAESKIRDTGEYLQ